MKPIAQPAAPPNQQIDPDVAWQQLLARDSTAEFFYAVATTGVFCRLGCGSRRPLRHNVRFFATVADASAAGFRACRRCRPEAACSKPLEQVRAYLDAHFDRAVPLEELAHIAGLSPFTVQRHFKQAFGVSPLQYQRAARSQRLRAALKEGESVTEAIYSAGFGSSSRAYEGAPLGMTPAKFAAGGRGEQIGYAIASFSLGWMIVGATPRGLCWLALADTESEAEQTLREEFPAAEIHRDPSLTRLTEAVVDEITGTGRDELTPPQEVDLRGTAFQLRVWEALRRIPRGETRSYSQLAAELGNPNATRAVARACATNRVAVLVPCHRVVGANGSLTGYRWGVERKRTLLEYEQRPPKTVN